MKKKENINPESFKTFTDLASKTFGGKCLFATDEWFAVADNMLNCTEPVFIQDKFTEYGKWMDGWETRRKRILGHDWCILEMGLPGFIKGFDVDTAFFTGNNAPAISIQAACLDKAMIKELETSSSKHLGVMGTCSTPLDILAMESKTKHWKEILSLTELGPGYESTRHNFFQVDNQERWTHLRINIYPDGGVARLRVYGIPSIDWHKISSEQLVDLVAASSGGRPIRWSNAHYGHPKNLIAPGRGINMGDGWETARKKNRPYILKQDDNGLLNVPGNDWAIFKTGATGSIETIEMDTNHFKGNFPESCQVEACWIKDESEPNEEDNKWKMLLPRTKLEANKQHYFSVEENMLQSIGNINYLKLTIFPDGGVSRFRAFGHRNDDP